jgi:hypothetical protein
MSLCFRSFEKEIQNKKTEEAVFQSEKRYHTLTEFLWEYFAWMLPDLPLMLIPAGVRFQDCHFKKL